MHSSILPIYVLRVLLSSLQATRKDFMLRMLMTQKSGMMSSSGVWSRPMLTQRAIGDRL